MGFRSRLFSAAGLRCRWTWLFSWLLTWLLLPVHPAHAATITSRTLLTGAYPSGTSGYGANTVVPTSVNLDVAVRVTAGVGVYSLTCRLSGLTIWHAVDSFTIDVNVNGGTTYQRYALGWGQFAECMVWERTAGATISTLYIVTEVSR